MNTDDKIRLLVDGTRGRYTWQHFVTACDPTEWHVQVEDLLTLEAGPDDENYDEAAANVLMEAYFEDNGHEWYLAEREGDIFAVRDDVPDSDMEAFYA